MVVVSVSVLRLCLVGLRDSGRWMDICMFCIRMRGELIGSVGVKVETVW